MAKIQERITFDQLLAHIEAQKHFTSRQVYYRKGHTTQTDFLDVLVDIRKAVDQRKVTLLTV